MRTVRDSLILVTSIIPVAIVFLLSGWSISQAEYTDGSGTQQCDCGIWGDVNADGLVNPVEVVFMVKRVYLGHDELSEPSNCPLPCGDVNGDGLISPVDVVFYVNYVYVNNDMFCPDPCGPVGSLIDYMGCKPDDEGATYGMPPDQDCIEYQYDGTGILLLKHINAEFNCCPEITTEITIEGNTITIEEIEVSAECFCNCLFDVDYEISNLPPGEYTIVVIEPYLAEGEEILQFTVDLVASPAGMYCVSRADPFTLDYGETIFLPQENLEITFESIILDCRCPIGVVCVWEGFGRIMLRVVELPADTHYVAVSRYGGDPSITYPVLLPVDTLGYRFTLLSLDPYPVHGNPVPDSAHTAMLLVFPYTPAESLVDDVTISDLPPTSIQMFGFSLDTVGIEGDQINLAINYGGGCGNHYFSLFMSPAAFLESYPAQANLYLRHYGDYDPCEAIIKRDLSFNIRPIAELYESMYGTLDSIILNMYHFFDSIPGDKQSILYFPEGGETSPGSRQQPTKPGSSAR